MRTGASGRSAARAAAPGTTGGGWTASSVLAALVVGASLNGVGLGAAPGSPLTLPRQLLYLPVIALAFAVGRRHRVTRPGLVLAALAATAGGAVLVGGLGSGVTVLFYATLGVGLPWLGGQALRHVGELAALAEERAEQVEATREAYALAAAASQRHHIAADLHDHVGHDLALIALQAGALETTTDGATRQGAARLRELAVAATDRLRTYVGELDGDVSAPTSVSDVVARAASTGMPVTLDGDSDHPVLVRAATEALTNAARHAAGRPVHVSAGPTALAVTNTTGDLAAAPVPPAGRGLRLLRGRVEAAGGHLFAARDGRTWRLAVDVPPARSQVR